MIWVNKNSPGLFWWLSGKGSAGQCRRHGFDPWSGRIPCAVEQRSPWATTTEAHALEPMLHSKRSHHSEKPAHRNEDPPQPKISRIKNKKKRRAAQRVKSPLINSYCNLQSANVNTCPKTSFTVKADMSTVTDKFCLSLKSTCIPKCGPHTSELWEGDHRYSGEQGEGGRI